MTLGCVFCDRIVRGKMKYLEKYFFIKLIKQNSYTLIKCGVNDVQNPCRARISAHNKQNHNWNQSFVDPFVAFTALHLWRCLILLLVGSLLVKDYNFFIEWKSERLPPAECFKLQSAILILRCCEVTSLFISTGKDNRFKGMDSYPLNVHVLLDQL